MKEEERRTCETCRHFVGGDGPFGRCGRDGGPMDALRLTPTTWLAHRDAEHLCHEPKSRKERP